MKKLNREDLIIKKSDTGQSCDDCPFKREIGTCLRDGYNTNLLHSLNMELAGKSNLFCETHTIKLKP
jgi:hypothetical protein